jgi:hypothetical protein
MRFSGCTPLPKVYSMVEIIKEMSGESENQKPQMNSSRGQDY